MISKKAAVGLSSAIHRELHTDVHPSKIYKSLNGTSAGQLVPFVGYVRNIHDQRVPHVVMVDRSQPGVLRVEATQFHAPRVEYQVPA